MIKQNLMKTLLFSALHQVAGDYTTDLRSVLIIVLKSSTFIKPQVQVKVLSTYGKYK